MYPVRSARTTARRDGFVRVATLSFVPRYEHGHLAGMPRPGRLIKAVMDYLPGLGPAMNAVNPVTTKRSHASQAL